MAHHSNMDLQILGPNFILLIKFDFLIYRENMPPNATVWPVFLDSNGGISCGFTGITVIVDFVLFMWFVNSKKNIKHN